MSRLSEQCRERRLRVSVVLSDVFDTDDYQAAAGVAQNRLKEVKLNDPNVIGKYL